jgi:FtsP/CotA-like multicopper oxidase with cupredoxin domain
VRLRFINGSAMSIFDVRIDGLPMSVVQSNGNDVQPATVGEFRISAAETYEVIVQPPADRAYTIFAQAEDRTGYARGTLAPAQAWRHRSRRWILARCARRVGGMDHGSMSGMNMDHGSMPGKDHSAMPGMNHGSMDGMSGIEAGPGAKKRQGSIGVDNVAEMSTERLNRAGEGFPARQRVLTYADLRVARPGGDPRPPSRDITLHLTGNMESLSGASTARNSLKPGRLSCSARRTRAFRLWSTRSICTGCGASSRTGTAITVPTNTRVTSNPVRS